MVEMLTWQVWHKNDFTYLIINLWKKRRKCQFFFNVIAKCYCDHPTPLGPTALLITWHVRKMKSIIGSFVSSHESHNENMIMGGLWSSCFSIRKATRLLDKGRFFESTEMLQIIEVCIAFLFRELGRTENAAEAATTLLSLLLQTTKLWSRVSAVKSLCIFCLHFLANCLILISTW